MIDCKMFQYAAAPRTGSCWMFDALSRAGLATGTRVNLHQPPADDYRGLLLTVVRNPADWLASYYYEINGGYVGVPEVDVFAEYAKQATCDADFGLSVANNLPGKVAAMFDHYRASTVLRLEDMPWSLAGFLRMFKPREDLSWLRDLPPINFRKQRTFFSDIVRNRIMAAEEEFCERYEYYA